MQPIEGGMLLSGSGETVEHVQIEGVEERHSLLLALRWDSTQQHLVFMDDQAKIIAEAKWQQGCWTFSGFAAERLPLHAIINTISWSRADDRLVAHQVTSLGGRYRSTPERRNQCSSIIRRPA